MILRPVWSAPPIFPPSAALCDMLPRGPTNPLEEGQELVCPQSKVKFGQGERVVVDEVSLPFLENATIDFTEELIGARFTIDNPNATSSCGCGTSFSM